MKKIIFFIPLLIMLFSTSVFAEKEITVKLDDKIINFDTAPCIINGRTMVPVRAIFESLGAEVLWDSDTRTVTALHPEKEVSMTIGVNLIKSNDSYIIMDITPMIINDRTYIPARFAAETFGNSVSWEENERTVHILTNIRQEIQYYSQYKNNNISLMYPEDWYVDESYISEGIIFIDNQGEKDIPGGMGMIMISEIEFSESTFSDIISTRYDYLLSDEEISLIEFKNTELKGSAAAEFRYVDKEGDYVISYFINTNKKVYTVSFISDKEEYFDNLCNIILSTFTVL